MIDINRIKPITTGLTVAPVTTPKNPQTSTDTGTSSTQSFGDLFSEKLKAQLQPQIQIQPQPQQTPTTLPSQQDLALQSGLNFSKHAVNRLNERNIDVISQISRLQNGFKTADEKGLNDALILVDNSAYIVNVKNKTVVTTVNNLQGSVFTNIDGAVFA